MIKLDVLWEKSDKIALALSGGVDSIVLFHLLATQYRNTYKELVVFHVNHGLREESYEEAEFVEKFVKNFHVKFYKEELNMKKLKRTSHISEEMKARELRYKTFQKMAKHEQVTKLLTAHHKNDQVENILMRLFSGRSIDHNLMIEEKMHMENLEILRPLLNVLKEDLEKYAAENDLKYYTDATNFDTDYTRNNIRHNIVPLLNDVNLASFDNLINFAKYYKNINSELRSKVLLEKEKYVIKKQGEKIFLAKDELGTLSKEEVYFFLKDLIKEEFGVNDVKQRAIFRAVDEIWADFGSRSYDLKKNLKIVSEYNSLYVHKIGKKCYNDKIELIIDETCLDEVHKFHQSEFFITTSNDFAEIGFNKEDLPLVVSARRAGDRIWRGSISKKLSRLFIDEKVPKNLRDVLPVVRSEDKVLGVLGIGTRVNKNKIYDYYIKMKG